MSNNFISYNGPLGTFEYNPNEFTLVGFNKKYLVYIGDEIDGKNIIIPEGITDCSYMFKNNRNLIHPPVIPYGVTNCSYMFYKCTNLIATPVIPNGVIDCSYMFFHCYKLQEAYYIPDTVSNCYGMFTRCVSLNNIQEKLPDNLKNAGSMFAYCTKLTKTPKIPSEILFCDYMFSYTGIKSHPTVSENASKYNITLGCLSIK